MTMKSVDPAHLRSVVLAGHAGSGKTTLAEQLLLPGRRHPAARARSTTGRAHLDFEPEEQKRKQSLCLAVATFEHDGDADHARRHARLPGLRRPRSSRASPRPTARCSSMDASGGVEAGLETAVALGRSTGRAACFFINKCDTENANPTAALDALRAAFGNKIAPLHLAIGKADGVRRLRRPRPPQGLRASTAGTEVEIPIPDELADEVAAPPRPAPRGGRRGRRRRPDQVPRGRGDQRRGARRLPPPRRPRLDPRPGPRRQRREGHRHRRRCSTRSSATCPPPPRSRRSRRTNAKTGADVEITPDPAGPLVARVVQDHRRPVRRAADLLPRPVRARSRRTTTSGTRTATRTSGSASSCSSTARTRSRSASSRRARSAPSRSSSVTETGDTLSSTREARSILPPLDFPPPTLPVAIEPQTKADLDKMGAALQRLLEEEPSVRVERSADRRAAARGARARPTSR